MLGVNLEDLEGDVAPAVATHVSVRGRVGVQLQEHQPLADPEHAGSLFRQVQRFRIETPVGRQIPDADPDRDLADPVMARRNQRDPVAFRVSQLAWRYHTPERSAALGSRWAACPAAGSHGG